MLFFMHIGISIVPQMPDSKREEIQPSELSGGRISYWNWRAQLIQVRKPVTLRESDRIRVEAKVQPEFFCYGAE